GLAGILGVRDVPGDLGDLGDLGPEARPERLGLGFGPGCGDGDDRQAQLLGAYADAGLLWAKVVGSTMALARALLGRGDRDAVRRLADFLAEAGEGGAAME